MSGLFTLIYVFLHQYLVPLLFVVGLMYLIYGVIQYHIQGNNFSDGREFILKSILWFAAGLIVYSVIALIGWLGTFTTNTNISTDSDANVNQTEGILKVPNVPTR